MKKKQKFIIIFILIFIAINLGIFYMINPTKENDLNQVGVEEKGWAFNNIGQSVNGREGKKGIDINLKSESTIEEIDTLKSLCKAGGVLNIHDSLLKVSNVD